MAQELRASQRARNCIFQVNGYTVKTTERLGKGGFGEVYLAHRADNPSEKFALKVLPMRGTKKAMARSEYEIQKELCDDDLNGYIARVFCMQELLGNTLIFMEYIPTGDLYQKCIAGDVDEADAHYFFTQLIEGLDYMHKKGFVHRDLKPENILVNSKDRIKITDFGLATRFRFGNEERLITVRGGTTTYWAPEYLTREPTNGPAVDIWAAGLILMNIVTGSNSHWEEPCRADLNYFRWCHNSYHEDTIWYYLEGSLIGLLKKMICPDVASRATMEDIRRHDWFRLF